MSNKKYRLLKDIDTPTFICKKGTVGERDGVLHCFKIANDSGTLDLSDEFMQNLEKSVFDQWFQEVVEPERVEINSLMTHDNFLGNKADTYWYQFCANQPLDGTKFPAIKQAIEQAINDNSPCVFDEKKLQERYEEILKNPPLYTEADIDKARREGFEAGRLMNIGGTITGFMGMGLKFNNYEDYKKSLNK